MGEAARLRYQKLFSPEAVVPLIEETYRRVANNGFKVRNANIGSEESHPWANTRNGK